MGMVIIKEILAGILFATFVIICRELFPSDEVYSVCWLPIAMGVTSLASGILGGIGQSAAADAQAKAQNRQNMNNWIQGENQKALNNGKELFQASHSSGQQALKNKQIFESAYLFKEKSLDMLQKQESYTQDSLSRNFLQQKSMIASNQANRNIQGGTSKILNSVHMIQGLKDAMQTDQNFKQKRINVENQVQNMLSQRTNNVYMANMNGATIMPEQQAGSTGFEIIGGVVGGIAGGMGAAASGIQAGLAPKSWYD